MLSAVRNVYNGKVSTAFNPDGPAVIPPSVTSSAWVQSLDFIGVDCYFTPPLPPWDGPGKLNPGDVHPPLPWQACPNSMSFMICFTPSFVFSSVVVSHAAGSQSVDATLSTTASNGTFRCVVQGSWRKTNRLHRGGLGISTLDLRGSCRWAS